MSNRRRGHDFERKVINDIKEKTKFKDCMSSRYASKYLDDQGVDIFGLPFNIQIKTLNKKPDILEILEHMPKEEKYNFAVIKRTRKTPGGTFREKGKYVVMSYDQFFKIINKIYEQDSTD
jgi:hypothetical protein